MASRVKNPAAQAKYISKRVCQEQFACDGSVASFECWNCGTRQCTDCEKQLHKPDRPKFASHRRSRIQQLLCTVECALCPYRPAEFSCLECKTVICKDCNKDYHQGKLSRHRRTPLPKQKEDNKEPTLESLELEAAGGMNSRTFPENCLPQSPFLDPLNEPIPCEITERQASLLSRELSNTTGLNLIEDEEFHSLTLNATDDKRSHDALSSPENLDMDRDFHSLGSEDHEREEPESLEFLSGHFEGTTVAQSHAIGRAETANIVNHEGMTVTHRIGRSTKQNITPGSGSSNVNKTLLRTERDRGGGNAPKSTSGNSQTIAGAEPQPDKRNKHSPDLYSNSVKADEAIPPSNKPGSEEINPLVVPDVSPLSSLEGSHGKKRMEAVVKPVGSVKAVPITSSVPRGIGRLSSIEDKQQQPVSGKVKQQSYQVEVETENDVNDPHPGGFLLVDAAEILQVKSAEALVEKLQCQGKPPVKVISIFGNTGDGKSHTLNHTFFGGQEVFHTSPTQDSCTIGVWAAYDVKTNVVVVDTEGLLGVSANENKRTRLLLKVLAISDVVIYRTRADRLHRDLFQFLGDASTAYLKHFTRELKITLEKYNMKGPVSTLGPAVIVFHETCHTLPLGAAQPDTPGAQVKSADTLLQERFKEHGCSMDAFSCVQYIGIQTIVPPTDFRSLKEAILVHVNNSSVRSPRAPEVVFHALKGLNDKFSGAIDGAVPSPFPDEYFTCSVCCLSCNVRCTSTMNHMNDSIPHAAASRCKYQHQFDNRVFICKACYQSGHEELVVPKVCSASDGSWFGMIKYAWSGFVLECPKHGVIYRSRQYWYGNQEPEMEAVRTEIRHVWPGGSTVLLGTHNAGRRLLDGIHHVVDTVSSVSAKPTKVMSQWMMDQIAPPYWRPNAEITACLLCKLKFNDVETIHHCRNCGEGFCDACSQRQLPVPERGWGSKPVRVCDECFTKMTQGVGGGKMPSDTTDIEAELESAMEETQPVTARKVGEVLQTTFGVLGTAINYPTGMLIEAARPAYWIPDSEIIECIACKEVFNPKLKKHHCRACGQGVCEDCSTSRRPVPSRGWDTPVRVCQLCNEKEGQL